MMANSFPKVPKQSFKGVLKNFIKFTGKHLCHSLFFNKLQAWDLQLQIETRVQLFSSEFCEISKNTFFYGTPLVAVSESQLLVRKIPFLEK